MGTRNYISLENGAHNVDDNHLIPKNEVGYYLKGDGTCLGIGSPDGSVIVATRGTEIATQDTMRDYNRVCYKETYEIMSSEYPALWFFGELLRPKWNGSAYEPLLSPQGYERHIVPNLIGFDVRRADDVFLSLDEAKEIYDSFKLPFYPCYIRFVPETLQDLYDMDAKAIALGAKFGREGLVGKTINGVFRWKCKHMTDKGRSLPEPRKAKPDDGVSPISDDDVRSNIDKTRDMIGDENFCNTKVAMPVLAQMCTEDAKKQGLKQSRNLFTLYRHAVKSLKTDSGEW